jgi:hypothetical protein
MSGSKNFVAKNNYFEKFLPFKLLNVSGCGEKNAMNEKPVFCPFVTRLLELQFWVVFSLVLSGRSQIYIPWFFDYTQAGICIYLPCREWNDVA